MGDFSVPACNFAGNTTVLARSFRSDGSHSIVIFARPTSGGVESMLEAEVVIQYLINNNIVDEHIVLITVPKDDSAPIGSEAACSLETQMPVYPVSEVPWTLLPFDLPVSGQQVPNEKVPEGTNEGIGSFRGALEVGR